MPFWATQGSTMVSEVAEGAGGTHGLEPLLRFRK